MQYHSISVIPVKYGLHQCYKCKVLIPPEKVPGTAMQQSCVDFPLFVDQPTFPQKYRVEMFTCAQFYYVWQSKGKNRGKRQKQCTRYVKRPFRIPC